MATVILCGLRSTFSAFAGYDDIGPERFEDYIFVVFHYIVPVLFEESLDPYDNYTPPSSTRAPGHLRPWRVEEYILGSLPCLYVFTYAASIYLSICAF